MPKKIAHFSTACFGRRKWVALSPRNLALPPCC